MIHQRAYWLFGSTVLGILALVLIFHALAWILAPMMQPSEFDLMIARIAAGAGE